MLFATGYDGAQNQPGDNRDFLLSDTVGFISQLPIRWSRHSAPLEEACTADLLLQVVDFLIRITGADAGDTETLKELQAGQIPCLYVMNKADLVMEESELPKVLGDRIYLSAKQGIGLAELLELIQKKCLAITGNARFDSVYGWCGGFEAAGAGACAQHFL
ncbi:MAG: hypothetical protein ACLURV_12905 [Gallintestinimicrobium sp.]